MDVHIGNKLYQHFFDGCKVVLVNLLESVNLRSNRAGFTLQRSVLFHDSDLLFIELKLGAFFDDVYDLAVPYNLFNTEVFSEIIWQVSEEEESSHRNDGVNCSLDVVFVAEDLVKGAKLGLGDYQLVWKAFRNCCEQLFPLCVLLKCLVDVIEVGELPLIDANKQELQRELALDDCEQDSLLRWSECLNELRKLLKLDEELLLLLLLRGAQVTCLRQDF